MREIYNINVVYIAGYGRSGSTIVDICLNQHNKVLGLGEFIRIFDDWEKLKHNEQWRKILEELEEEFENLDTVYLDKISRQIEKYPIFLLSKKKIHTYKQFWSKLFKKLEKIDVELIIDSTKTTRRTIFRPKRLRSLGLRVDIVYLHRPFKDILKSIKKGSNNKLEKEDKSNINLFFIIQSLLGYVYTILTTKLFYLNDYKKLSFVDFLRNPAKNLNMTLDAFYYKEITYDNDMFKNMESGMGIRGNRTRRSKKLTLRVTN